jgi:serine/threonine-protein kinase RsbW
MSASAPRDPETRRESIRNAKDTVERVQNELVAAMERQGYAKASIFAVRLAFQEAISNAFNHGHKHLPEDVTVDVGFTVDDSEVTLHVEDQGPGFDPNRVPDPTADENLEQTSGRGVLLIKAYMSRVTYNDRGNRVEMTYRKPQPKNP